MRNIILSAVLLLGLQAARADRMYTVTNLGGMGGAEAVAFGISNSGEVVGWAQNAYGATSAFRAFPDFALESLPTAGASDSFAYCVNNSGTIASTAYTAGQPHGMILAPSGVSDLGSGTYALAVNSSGEVAGAANGHAQLYASGAVTDLGSLPGGTWSAAYGINNAGAIAGTSDNASGQFRAIVWTQALGMTDLGTFGGSNSYAMSINDGGAA